MGCCIRTFAVNLSVLTIVIHVFIGLIWNSVTNYWFVLVLYGVPVFSAFMLILGAITTATVILSIYLVVDCIRIVISISAFIYILVALNLQKEAFVEKMLNMEGLHCFLRNHKSDFKDINIFDYIHYCLTAFCVYAFLEIVNNICMLSLGRSIKQSANRNVLAT